MNEHVPDEEEALTPKFFDRQFASAARVRARWHPWVVGAWIAAALFVLLVPPLAPINPRLAWVLVILPAGLFLTVIYTARERAVRRRASLIGEPHSTREHGLKITAVIAALVAFVAFFLSGCSPYAKDLATLDRLYKAGRFTDREYFEIKTNILAADAQWRANFAASMANANAQFQQGLYQQQQINAYNARTRALSAPRYDSLNVHHSGSVGVYDY